MFQNLSIGTKITSAIFIFLFPILLLGYFLFAEKEDLINFTKQEIAGVHYLRAGHEALAAVTSPANSDALKKAADALDAAEKEDAGYTAVTQKSKDLAAMLRAGEGDMVAKATDLITSVSDNSNITLDPDGDAYFIGDMIVNQTPGVLVQLSNLLAAAKEVDKDASDNNKIAYAEARDGAATNIANIATDLGKAIKNNGGGTIQPALEESGKALADAAAKLAAAAQGSNRAALASAAANLAQITHAFAVKNNDVMQGLLDIRNAGFYKMLITRLTIATLAVIAGGIIFFVVIRSITKPVSTITSLMGRLTRGELDMEIPKSDRRDEIGTLMISLQAFHDAAIEKEKARKIEVERAENENKRAQLIQNITSNFEAKIQDIVATVSAASIELTHTAEEVTKVMKTTADNAKTAAQGSTQTSDNVQSVASAAEEMSASVKEISAQVQRTNQLANDSRDKTIAADEKASQLGDASQKVKDAVTLIASIAGQINLLALNATIESARAGEAGKGFAVVASEVKNLANQTNKSVEDVGRVIEEVNIASNAIISVLRSIKESAEDVSNASSNIAAAVEEQSATTNEITRNMQAAAQGTIVISENLDSVSASSSQASASAGEVLGAAQELSRQSEELNKEVTQFLRAIRAT